MHHAITTRHEGSSAVDSGGHSLEEEVRWDGRFWMVQGITGARVVLAIVFPAVAVLYRPRFALAVYLLALLTDVADGALARHFVRATRGGDWFDTLADRLVTTMSAVYGLLTGAPILACSLIVARDLCAASMSELQSEAAGNGRRARFLGIITVTPVRVITAYILILKIAGWSLIGVSFLFWMAAAIGWTTFAMNAWLRRGVVARWFRESDIEKLLR